MDMGWQSKARSQEDKVKENMDSFARLLFAQRSKDAVNNQPVQCEFCEKDEECEWERGFGVRMRIFANKFRNKYQLGNWQIRYNLYRLYHKVKHPELLGRHPLPFCVEVGIKRTYPGTAPHAYTFYKKGKKDGGNQKQEIDWCDGWDAGE
jgi:hypothetical protein